MKRFHVKLKNFLRTLSGHWLFRLLYIALVIECFLFNYRHWESLFYPQAAPSEIYAESGAIETEPGVFTVGESNSAVIVLSGINAPVKSLYLAYPGALGSHSVSVPVQIRATDAGNAFFFSLPETEIVQSVPESQYIRLYLSGTTEKLAVHISAKEGATLRASGFLLNAVRPFLFRPFRFLNVFILCVLLYLFFPGSKLYRIQLDLSQRKQQITIFTSILAGLALYLFIGWAFYDPYWESTTWPANLQYNLLAEAFKSGQTWLNIDAPAALANIENPYDPPLRLSALEKSGESYIVDFAYRNGQYYCYFGVVPVILFYLPYLVLTGKWLSTGLLILGLTCVYIIALYWLMYELIKKNFPETSIGLYLLMTAVLLAGSEVTYCVQMSTIYSVPFICSLAFVATGLSCWVHAARPSGSPKKPWLVAGSAFIALTVGCRPQFAIATLFAFPIFGREIRERLFFSRKGLANTLCVIIPYLMIDSCFLYYNYIRFGSILDFGATYNLTGFDMTHKSFHPMSFVLGYYEYFFQPFKIQPRFPYFSVVTNSDWSIPRDYQAQVISEPMLGGFFSFNLIGIFLFNLRSVKAELKRRGCYGLVLLALLSGIVLVSLDIQMVGMTLRYLTDFSFFLMLAAILVVTATICRETYGSRTYRSLLSVVVFLSFLCIAANYLTLIAAGRYNTLSTVWPDLYFRLKYQYFTLLGIR